LQPSDYGLAKKLKITSVLRNGRSGILLFVHEGSSIKFFIHLNRTKETKRHEMSIQSSIYID